MGEGKQIIRQDNHPLKSTFEVPFFFILGRPRSGTTLLQTVFEAHPNCIFPAECAVLVKYHNKYKYVKFWTEEKLNKLYDGLYEIRKFESWQIDKEKLKSELLLCQGNTHIDQILKVIYANYISVFEKKELKILGDKNPAYSKYPNLIHKWFPDAKFIHITRDYRDHILSMQKTNLLDGIVPLISYLWRNSQRKMLKFIKKHPSSVYSIKYEEFVNNPEFELEKMCGFLNIPYEAEVLDFRKRKEDFENKYPHKINDTFHANLFKPINADKVYDWKQKMAEGDIKLADYIVGKFAQKSGYEPKYNTLELSKKIKFWLKILHLNLYYFMIFILNFLPYQPRTKLKSKLPTVSKWWGGK